MDLRDLAGPSGQDRRIADMASGALVRGNVQCLRVDPEVDLAPGPPLGAAMFAGVPFVGKTVPVTVSRSS
jgi:hypothetical protein